MHTSTQLLPPKKQQSGTVLCKEVAAQKLLVEMHMKGWGCGHHTIGTIKVALGETIGDLSDV
jgi:hypothetical protein